MPPRGADAAVARRGRLLRLGLPRDVAATRNLTAFVVVTVATVLVTRMLLAASGYPQVGGGGLHVAHVLWGGLGMALAMMLLLSYLGSVVRPVAVLVGGIGFGLFVDEIGKFVTSDNDYFYEPTAALVYGVMVALVLLAEALHGRREHHPSEYLSAAVDRAVAGVAGGFTADAREEAERLAERGSGVPGSAEVRALIDAVPDDASELADPVAAVSERLERAVRGLLGRSWVGIVVVGLVAVSTLISVLVGARALGAGVLGWDGLGPDDVPVWVAVGVLVSAGVSLVLLVLGVVVGRDDERAGAAWVRRAVLVSLLVTQLLVFRVIQWPAVAGLVVDLVAFGVLEVAAGRNDLRGGVVFPTVRKDR